MKIDGKNLTAHLQKELGRVYFLSGDEPLQMMEAAAAIRKTANKKGFQEREILSFDGHSDWSELFSAGHELSLFSQQKILEVRLAGCQPGKKGSEVIRNYLENIPQDKVLLLQTGKLDKNARTSAWAKALEKAGVMLQFWDLSPAQTMAWVEERMRQQGLKPFRSACRLLTERIEGNLLAADQEIKKLALLFGQVEITDEHIIKAVADSSRFSVFDLSDAVLSANMPRIHHILSILREEGTPLQLVLWSLSTLSRQLYDMQSCGAAPGYMPAAKKALMKGAVRRLHQPDWAAILKHNLMIDRMTKGQGGLIVRDERRIWNVLLDYAVLLSGHDSLAAPT